MQFINEIPGLDSTKHSTQKVINLPISFSLPSRADHDVLPPPSVDLGPYEGRVVRVP